MATVAQVAKASLQRILVQASESVLEPAEYSDYIFSLNNYMTELDAQGIQLGFTEVSDLGDDVTIPAGALRGVIANMAIEVSPDYGGVISDGLVKAAREGMNTMRQIGQSMGTSKYPGTLPKGSGNDGGWDGSFGYFYPDSEADILAETTGAISLETDTT
jgi:hypothetical protein|tara:strand:+ start:842 stop:1321 length:480 start_codon:yes stop_codon:yes gene_type:complete